MMLLMQSTGGLIVAYLYDQAILSLVSLKIRLTIDSRLGNPTLCYICVSLRI